jgi:hypothetical protein
VRSNDGPFAGSPRATFRARSGAGQQTMHFQTRSSCLARQRNTVFCRGFRSRSDGTRTRDLRRDRPSQVPRRLGMNSSERLHLQVVLRTSQPASPWLSQASNRRLGHERATNSCLPRQHGAGREDVSRRVTSRRGGSRRQGALHPRAADCTVRGPSCTPSRTLELTLLRHFVTSVRPAGSATSPQLQMRKSALLRALAG